MAEKRFKISFCIICMNRLHHLKKTLKKNIIDNENYESLEFILLDYNSSDHVDNYIRSEMMEYIKSGKLVYHRTTTPLFFNRSHSRNVAFKLANGDIICNIDADNFTGEGFAHYVNSVFNRKDNIFLSTIGGGFKKDALGRICVKRDDFHKIKGYDERMTNYGFEDYDFANRLEMIGLERIIFETKLPFFNVIYHKNEERLSNEFASKNISFILMNYLTPSSTDIIFLFKNKLFERHIYVDNTTFNYIDSPTKLEESQLKYSTTFIKAPFKNGIWDEHKNEIILTTDLQEKFCLKLSKNKKYYVSDFLRSDFYKIVDSDIIQQCILMYSRIKNRIIMCQNKIEGNFAPNKADYGIEVIYENFSKTLLHI